MTRPEWSRVELDDLRAPEPHSLVGGPFGSDLTQKDYVPAPGVPVLRGINLGGNDSRFVDEGFVFVSEEKARSLSRNTAFRGDIVFTQRGTLGQVVVIPDDSRFERYVISQSQMKLTPDRQRVCPRFLYHYFRSPAVLTRLLGETLATGVPHINLGILKRFPVAMPPLGEQQRIAAILDQGDALRAKRRAAMGKLDVLPQSLFLDHFGDPLENHRWPSVTLGSLILRGPQNGIYKPASEYGSGARILRIDAFYDGEVTGLTSLKRVRLTEEEAKTFALASGDIVINRVNSPEYLGKSALIPDLHELTVFESNMMRLRLDEQRALPRFVIEFLQTPFIRSQIRRAAKDAVNQSSINQRDVSSFTIRLPPLDLQREFARRVQAVDALKAAQHRSLAKLDALFASLQHRAFRGEL